MLSCLPHGVNACSYINKQGNWQQLLLPFAISLSKSYVYSLPGLALRGTLELDGMSALFMGVALAGQ